MAEGFADEANSRALKKLYQCPRLLRVGQSKRVSTGAFNDLCERRQPGVRYAPHATRHTRITVAVSAASPRKGRRASNLMSRDAVATTGIKRLPWPRLGLKLRNIKTCASTHDG